MLVRTAENIWLLRNLHCGHLAWSSIWKHPHDTLTLPAPEQVPPPLWCYFRCLLHCSSHFCGLKHKSLDMSPAVTVTVLDRGHSFHLSDSINLHQALKLNAPVLLQKLIPTVEKLPCYFSGLNEVKWVMESFNSTWVIYQKLTCLKHGLWHPGFLPNFFF